MPEIFIGRQPIYDREMRLQAYELLSRAGNEGQARFVDGHAATTALIRNIFLDLGLDRLVGNKTAYLNLTRSFLTDGTAFSFPKERVVLELLEDIVIDEEIIEGVRALTESGYSVALDDYVYQESHASILNLVKIVKIDLTRLTPADLRRHVELLRPHDVKLLAEKVETREQYSICKALGFDYFQGYYLSRPVVVQGKGAPTTRLAMMHLLSKVYEPRVDLKDLEDHVASDAALRYRLLRFINSAFYGLPKPVEDLRRGLLYLGLAALRNWIAILILREIEDERTELLLMALVRARMAQRLAEEAHLDRPGDFFTAGLFSVLECTLQLPMAELLEDLPLSPEIKAALLSGQGPMGDALACTLAFEGDSTTESRHFHGLDAVRTGALYLECVAWAHDVAANTAG
jgi:c-di-GMP phosphodiesterase